MSVESEAVRFLRGVQSFADEMRAKGIHVGLGKGARCVVDDEPWPCSHERSAKAERESNQETPDGH